MHLERLSVSQEIKQRLGKLLSGKVPHLLVFASPNGKQATECAKAWLCDWLGIEKTEHPDLLELTCTGKVSLHSVESIRNLIEQLSLTPYSLQKRGVYIDAAERMLPSASNSLLKILEEPPNNTVIILATAAPHQILPTILSRAQMVRLPGIPEEILLPLALRELIATEAPSYAQILRAAEKVEAEVEEEREALLKQLRDEKNGEESTVEGEVGLMVQRRSAQLFEAVYLAMRQRTSPLLLQQALDAIQRSSDLKNTLTWFLTASQ